MEKEFCLEKYLSSSCVASERDDVDKMESFVSICRVVESAFEKEWSLFDDEIKNRKLEQEKRVLMGYEEETMLYKEKIKEILREKKLQNSWYPDWYPNLWEGIFAEIYGLAGIAPWAYDMDEKYIKSSSAKIIGDRIFCLIDGKSQLQPQTIDKRRRDKLKRAFLLATPRERIEYGFHEVYLRNGIRITIYSGDRTKEDQDIMVFRKYVLENLSFDILAEKGTVPEEAVPLFKAMVDIGFNVLFCGQVRSGKTTFLQIWQKNENPSLEGVAVSTDPETPWHKIMPEAPIMQIVADDIQLGKMTKSLLRGDNDYIVLEEMRDATAFKLALDITSTGTGRTKGTIHTNNGIGIPYRIAAKIKEKYGTDERDTIGEFFRNFDYAIELSQMEEDKSKKIMKGILEYSYDEETDQVKCMYVCKYDYKNKTWQWNPSGGKSKMEKYPECREKTEKLIEIIESLAKENEMEHKEAIFPGYYESRSRREHNGLYEN